ncbi:MAG: hypothetical protein N2037_06040 [Acidimicrobiales bacterium]|nr:hypothetical protein [Acidimicrobiales bacterium]
MSDLQHPTTFPTETRATRPGGRLLALGLWTVATLAAGLFIGCGSTTRKTEAAGATTTLPGPSTTAVAGQDSNRVESATGQAGQQPRGQGGGGQASGPSGGGAGSQTPKPSSSSPVIVSFKTPDSIDCHNGNFQTFTASWTTTNAVKVTISIDGPGIYDTYPANGDTSLPFNCSSSHTFLLTAYDKDDKTATKSITLHPRNVQPEGSTAEEQ